MGKVATDQKMSRGSRATMKGISFNYLRFLWNGIAAVRRAQLEGQNGSALEMAATLIIYLPREIKKDFQKKADKIILDIGQIRNGVFQNIAQETNPFMKALAKRRAIEAYACGALPKFLSELTTSLDDHGYYLSAKTWEEGWSHTSQEDREQDEELTGNL